MMDSAIIQPIQQEVHNYLNLGKGEGFLFNIPFIFRTCMVRNLNYSTMFICWSNIFYYGQPMEIWRWVLLVMSSPSYLQTKNKKNYVSKMFWWKDNVSTLIVTLSSKSEFESFISCYQKRQIMIEIWSYFFVNV